MKKTLDLLETVCAFLIVGCLVFALPLFLLIHNITTVGG